MTRPGSKNNDVKEAFRIYLQEKAGVTDTEWQLLAGDIMYRSYEKDAFLLRSGEVCHHVFFVSSGLLRAYTLDEAGKEHILQFASENWWLSDRSSIYFHTPTEYFIQAIEPTEVAMLDAAFMEKATEVSASFRRYNEQILQRHIYHLQHRINLLLSASAEKRYLEFTQLYPDLMLRAPQWMIASYLGITPESLSRVRKELARKNFRPQDKSFLT